MTYLDEEGILADNLEVFAALVRDKYAPWVTEARAYNRIANQMQYSFKVRPESAQDLFCSALFVRVLEYTQTALLLIERGLRAPARVMLRCAVEALFNLTACSANYKTAVSFMDADLIARKKTGEYLQQVSGEPLKAHVVGKDITKRLIKLADEIDSLDAKALQVRQLAKLADLEDWYLTTYAYLSSSIHSSVRDLEGYFEFDLDGKIKGMVNEPSDRGLELLILLAVEIQHLATQTSAKTFGLTIDPKAQVHLEAIQALKVTDSDGIKQVNR
jgi:hypothetical protein